MPPSYLVRQIDRPVDATISIPGSKSITNRALILAALADDESVLEGLLDSQDTQVMVESLRRLGFEIAGDAASGSLRVKGRGGAIAAAGADLFLANSGTSIRFLTALCAL